MLDKTNKERARTAFFAHSAVCDPLAAAKPRADQHAHEMDGFSGLAKAKQIEPSPGPVHLFCLLFGYRPIFLLIEITEGGIECILLRGFPGGSGRMTLIIS